MSAYQIAPRPSSLVKPQRSEKYKRWLRTQPCACCQHWIRDGKHSEAAHTGHRGAATAQKANDWDAIPLCEWCHRIGPRAYHAPSTGSEEAWAAFYDLNLPAIRRSLWRRYPGKDLPEELVEECGR